MATSLVSEIQKIASTDIFKRKPSGEWDTGTFIGRPFYLDYARAQLLVADSWKQKAQGVPQGAFLLAYYEDEQNVLEAVLLRVLQPARLPTDSDIVSSMVEYYKENLQTTGQATKIDSFTRYEFSFSGLECRVLGTLYTDKEGKVRYGADLENFYSAHHYGVIKPNPQVLEFIVNLREGAGVTGKPSDFQIGYVRYSSSSRYADQEPNVPVYVSPQDFLGKRTALFGMTRTGKSNTVKTIIQATVLMSDKAAQKQLPALNAQGSSQNNGATNGVAAPAVADMEPLSKDGFPKYPVGQIIFDINGEYANPNLQDAGTAISEIYKERTTRYSTLKKTGFKEMKVNFYLDVSAGFKLVCNRLENDAQNSDYVGSFVSVTLDDPKMSSTWFELSKDEQESAATRYERKRAAYLCCLFKAGFIAPKTFSIKFTGNQEINKLVKEDGSINPTNGITLEQACNWFSAVWSNYKLDDPANFFAAYKKKKGREWADEDLQALLTMLTKRKLDKREVSGYVKLREFATLHTDTVQKPFEQDIIDELRQGRIVIIDLSQGDDVIQKFYSERLCRAIFTDAMGRFIQGAANNFIQFYFEEAHNLFPKKDDKDLSQIYNRIAKEGAKLNLGLAYATQEVSSISGNILKNTQNWFIAHLNNDDETREIKKYYDFGDFTDSLVRFSAGNDKGFVRMKTYSNPFVVPVQVNRFPKGATN